MEKNNIKLINENIINIKQAIQNKADKDVSLILATKTIEKDILVKLSSYGKLIFGENRVQEFMAKYFTHPNVSWHFIGQLQSNKVKYIIDKVDLIHSVDRMSLALEISKQAKKINKTMDILIEINVADENSKGGIVLMEALNFTKKVAQLDNICVKGIMAVMPNIEIAQLKQYYLQLQSLYAIIKKSIKGNIQYLSAGMSGDYMTAIEYGSNMVRIGSAIFGAR